MKYLTRTTFAETVIKLDLLETRPSGNLPRACAVGLTCKAVGPYSSAMRSFVPFPAVLLAAACTSCGIADGASTPSDKPAQTCRRHSPPRLPAAQANADRFSSGDFAGVWERMSREVRDGITREDFVTFYETCKKTGQKIRVAGVRLDAGDAALVRMEVGGTDQSRVMLFENGNRVMKPTRLIQVTPNPNWRQTLAASAAMKPPPMIRWDGYAAPPSSLIPRKVGLARDLAQQWGVSQGHSR